MGTDGPNKVSVSAVDEAEDTATTVEIKIKTLDSQTYTLRVNKCVPVPALKEQIATVTGVLSEQQRLICRGKVLKDDQLLSAYHVEDGHTLHLVSRQPILSSSAMGSEGPPSHQVFSSDSTGSHDHGNPVSHSIVFETVNIDQGDRSPSSISRILANVINSIASAGIGTGNSRTDFREASSERFGRTPGNISSSDGHDPQPSSAAAQADADLRQPTVRFPSTVNLGFQQPAVIPDSVTTIHQYIYHMREAFRNIGNGTNNNLEGPGAHVSEGHSNGFQSRPVSGQGSLPTAASLAAILLSSRELLDHAGEHLSQFAQQLGNQESMTDLTVRMNTQSSAMRSGLLLQNLGSLLLELGRTTMTLRMGDTPADAMVNAGPPVYISATGPNPIMVQPAPFHPGSNFGVFMGTANSVPGLESQPVASAHLPRNTDVWIHAGHRNPVASVSLGEQIGAHQTQVQTDSVRNSHVANFIHQAFSSGATGSSSFTGEPGVRMFPIRTVVAVPAGVSRSPADSSGRSTGVFYPLFARIQRQNSGIVNEARGPQSTTEPQSGGPETDQQPILESSMRVHLPTNPMPIVSGMSASTNGPQYQGPSSISISSQGPPANNNDWNQSQDMQQTRTQVLGSLDQLFRNSLTGEENYATGYYESAAHSATNQADIVRSSEEQEAYVDGEDQGIVFSNLVRQIMPFISPATAAVPDISPTDPISSTGEIGRESSTDPRSSRRDRDPSEVPNTKRPRVGDGLHVYC